MHKAPVILLLFAILLLLFSSCGSARHLQEVRKVDSTAVDRSTIIIRDTVTQVVNQVITQTVVEYYPVYDTVYLQSPEVAVPVSGEIASCAAAAPPPPVPQPIKSITRTEIRTDAALQSSKDSVAHMDTDIHLKTLSDTDTKEGEPAYIKTLRLVAIILALLLLLFLAIKIRSILR